MSNRCASVLSCLIFQSRVERGMPSLAAAPFGPPTLPLLSASAASINCFSSFAERSPSCKNRGLISDEDEEKAKPPEFTREYFQRQRLLEARLAGERVPRSLCQRRRQTWRARLFHGK